MELTANQLGRVTGPSGSNPGLSAMNLRLADEQSSEYKSVDIMAP